LANTESKRWAEVISCEMQAATRLVEEAGAEFARG
jgi:hypothetical protein